MGHLAHSSSLPGISPVISLSADGRRLVVPRRGLICLLGADGPEAGRTLMQATHVVASAVVPGAV